MLSGKGTGSNPSFQFSPNYQERRKLNNDGQTYPNSTRNSKPASRSVSSSFQKRSELDTDERTNSDLSGQPEFFSLIISHLQKLLKITSLFDLDYSVENTL